MGRNDYAKKLNERRRQRDELMLFWGMQICADAITFALNDPEVMGRDTLGRTRIKRIEQAVPGIAAEIMKGIVKSEEAEIALSAQPCAATDCPYQNGEPCEAAGGCGGFEGVEAGA